MTRPVFVDSRRDLLAGLIDYAGLFPPASLDLTDAVAEYRQARSGDSSWILGTFVIRATHLEDLAALLVTSMVDGEPPWEISAILDGDPATAAASAAAFEAHMSPAATVVGVEVAMPGEVADAATSPEAAAATRRAATAATSISTMVMPYLEVPSGGESAVVTAVEAIGLLRNSIGRSLGAKLRCGGHTADLFPEPGVVAAFIVACRDRAVPFKATAGLHHPVRHRDEDLGVMRHGFLNLLIASALAEEGADISDVAAVVAETDESALKVGSTGSGWRDLRASAATVKQVRVSRFRSFGSCSFDEPIADMTALGIVTAT